MQVLAYVIIIDAIVDRVSVQIGHIKRQPIILTLNKMQRRGFRHVERKMIYSNENKIMKFTKPRFC